jgi:glycosyltransferase involved in cell wall biosynthesis
MLKNPIINDPRRPLVSVMIFNYNYARYLRECFDSVFAQTYANIEICFSDNASKDESWDIALEYAKKYPGTTTLTCNRKNFGVDANFANCWLNVRGKYLVELCSDDALMPEYISTCVHALESHPNAGFAMVHRTIIDEKGRRTEEPPFYNRSCVIPGPEQAAVYMMAAVNPSVSQIMYRKMMTHGKAATGGIAARWYGTRILDFNMCCEFSMLYIKEPLLLHRLHFGNDSFKAAENLMEVIGPYVLQHQFVEIAAQYDLPQVVERLPKSLNKLAHLCLRYCLRSLAAGQVPCARRYFHLALAVMPEITEDPIFKLLEEYWSSDPPRKSEILDLLKGKGNVITRSVSYDPPPGSVPLELRRWAARGRPIVNRQESPGAAIAE